MTKTCYVSHVSKGGTYDKDQKYHFNIDRTAVQIDPGRKGQLVDLLVIVFNALIFILFLTIVAFFVVNHFYRTMIMPWIKSFSPNSATSNLLWFDKLSMVFMIFASILLLAESSSTKNAAEYSAGAGLFLFTVLCYGSIQYYKYTDYRFQFTDRARVGNGDEKFFLYGLLLSLFTNVARGIVSLTSMILVLSLLFYVLYEWYMKPYPFFNSLVMISVVFLMMILLNAFYKGLDRGGA